MRLAVLDLAPASFHLAVFEAGPPQGPHGVLGCRRSWSQSVRLSDLSRPLEWARGLSALQRLLRDLAAFDSRCPVASAAGAALRAFPGGPGFCDQVGEHLGAEALADELELPGAGAQELGTAELARLVDVLAQFRPIDLPALGLDEARSDTIAVGAVVMHTLMELLGFESALLVPAGRREGVALRQLGIAAHHSTDGRVHTAVT